MKARLDQQMAQRGLVRSRSQAESYIKLGKVTVDGKLIKKSGFLIDPQADIQLTADEQYVSRAALKLASVAGALKLDFTNKIVLDVGSSTGGFTDYALRQGAKKVIAVEVGKDQLHPSLRGNPRIELHERTDIRDVQKLEPRPDMVVADVSFISLRELLPHIAGLSGPDTQLVMMVKPQFEAGQAGSKTGQGALKHKGVIKNDKLRRDILKDFESWAQQYFRILDKADSAVSGAKGNQERFYLLKKLA